ncbi:hypothetical protein ABT084_02710 [Streptomyces sp. NPDC002138]|uniref:hypothetical protein n=1 Tax=Streptomyces sp. NPDC002138 TaxID=3154410 RepID=UPI0033225D2B
MDEQGGAGGVPPHDGHEAGRAARRAEPRDDDRRRDDDRTAAADTDEASRLDRPDPAPGPVKGRRRWTSPADDDGEPRRAR